MYGSINWVIEYRALLIWSEYMSAKCLASRLRGEGLGGEYCEDWDSHSHRIKVFFGRIMALLIEYRTLLFLYNVYMCAKCVWHDSFKCALFVWHGPCICVTWPIHIWDMTRWYMRYDSFDFVNFSLNSLYVCMSWLIHMSDMTHPYVRCDSFIYVIWLMHICDLTQWYVWRDSIMCASMLMFFVRGLGLWF